MTTVTILAIIVVVGIPLLLLVTRLAPRMDRRANVEVEQELQGVGDEQKQEPGGSRGPGLMG